ncbi:hypothetical protein AFM16_13095 [Streptomyces antibioticus]|uniref:Transposase n=1 Tax=Streptomyces antibioticus TaxID=1890 RepID=A0ABX3LJT1_STRAT|nr:hypothetical protein AFM16_13095 [Streptomyces antibioticus]
MPLDGQRYEGAQAPWSFERLSDQLRPFLSVVLVILCAADSQTGTTAPSDPQGVAQTLRQLPCEIPHFEFRGAGITQEFMRMEKHLLPDVELRGFHVIRQTAEHASGIVTPEQAFLAVRRLPRQYTNHIPLAHVFPSTLSVLHSR